MLISETSLELQETYMVISFKFIIFKIATTSICFFPLRCLSGMVVLDVQHCCHLSRLQFHRNSLPTNRMVCT